MMAAANGVVIVKPKLHTSWHPPSEPPSRERIAFERIQSAVVPRQDVATQARPPSCDRRKQLVEPRRRIRLVRHGDVRQEIGVGSDIPAQTEHSVARLQQSPPDEAEVLGRVLNAIEAGCALDTPAVFPWLDNPFG